MSDVTLTTGKQMTFVEIVFIGEAIIDQTQAFQKSIFRGEIKKTIFLINH